MSSHIPQPLSSPEPADGHSPSLGQLSHACSSQVHKNTLNSAGKGAEENKPGWKEPGDRGGEGEGSMV